MFPGGRTGGVQESRGRGQRAPGPAPTPVALRAAPGAQPAPGSPQAESRGSGTRSGTPLPAASKDRAVRGEATARLAEAGVG